MVVGQANVEDFAEKFVRKSEKGTRVWASTLPGMGVKTGLSARRHRNLGC